TGKVVIGWSPTRWSGAYLALKRILELREVLEEEFEFVNYERISIITKSLEPLYKFQTDLEGRKSPTIHRVVQLLQKTLFELGNDGENPYNKFLIDKINQRFYHILDGSAENFEPVYTMATWLHPMLRHSLDDCQNINVDNTIKEFSQKFLVADTYMELLARRQMSSQESLNSFDEVFDLYKKLVIDPNEDVLVFWSRVSSRVPRLFVLANIIFSVQATSAASESIFSRASFALGSRRWRLKPSNLEKEIFIALNHEYDPS
ncbi:hypothetical protein SNEBB_009022, partial [Seison nebaliae]